MQGSRALAQIENITVKGNHQMLIKSISDLAITKSHEISQLATFPSLDHFAIRKFVFVKQ